jgi:hypothetical protein
MKRYFKYLCLLSFSITNISCAESSDSYSAKYSGKYEQISVAVSNEGHVTGFFKEQMGDNFSCYFGFYGDLVDGKATITVADEGYEGSITFQDKNIILAIPEAQELPGCGMVLIPMIATGVEYGPKDAADWIDIKIVPHDGVVLRKDPNTDAEPLIILNKWHVLGVLENKKDWLKVSYFYIEETQDGWIEGFKEGWVESSALKSIK